MHSYILFFSSNYTIWADNSVKDAGFECKMVSVPRDMSSDCGYCLKVKSEDIEAIQKLLTQQNIPIDCVESR